MYQVVIVDDEPIIVEGLTKVIAWESYGCQVAATASNGAEGIEAVQKTHPDILFSDIAMPGMSGLEMIAGLKSEYSGMEICILTGYRDFDYAQEAIRLGVTRFLLKPSNMAELNEAVQAMAANLEKKQKRQPGQDITIASKEDNAANSFIVTNAIRYLEEHYTEKVTLAELAEKVYVSQWHLSKLLNRHVGQSFSEIQNGIRIRHAKELLMNPALRIIDVSEETGFMDAAHFSRVFKKVEGISANEYRNTILGK